MSNVIVRTPIIGGGAVLTKLFTDSFVRADTTRGLGPNWLQLNRTGNQSNTLAYPGARIFGNTCRFFCDGGAGGNQIPGFFGIPVPLINNAVKGKSQFSQFTFNAKAGGDKDVGGAVMCNGDFNSQTQQCYFWQLEAVTIGISVMTTGGGGRVDLTTFAYVPAANDVIRLEVVPGAASNHVALIINSVIVIDIPADATAGSPRQAGYPGLGGTAVLVGGTMDLSAFSGGFGTTFI